MITETMLRVSLDAPATAVTLLRTAQALPLAVLTPLPLGDVPAARAEPWRIAAAMLEYAVGPAWRDLPLPWIAQLDLPTWRLLRRALIADHAAASHRLSDLFSGAAWLAGLPHDWFVTAHAVPQQLSGSPYQPALSGGTPLQLDWRPALVQLTIDCFSGSDAAQAAEYFRAAVLEALVSVCQTARAATTSLDVQIAASAALRLSAELLQARLRAAGFTPQILPTTWA